MTETSPKINFSRIRFPSDRLTLADLRRLFPEEFALNVVDFVDASHSPGRHLLSGLLLMERDLAWKAFSVATGRADSADDSRDQLVRMTNDEYRRFGLSTGAQMTAQLVREIEIAAAAQAAGKLSR